MDNNSLAHTKWECKYHIVFAPKYSVWFAVIVIAVISRFIIWIVHPDLPA